MRLIRTEIADVLILEPIVHGDERGFFMESFNLRAFREATGRELSFVQDNQSRSRRGVLRGLHYQLPPQAQAKLVRVSAGEIFDVAVDVRADSPTFGRWVGAHLSSENHRQLWVPEGFAHGFLTLSETADVQYKASTYYAPAQERAILWNDPAIGIQWPLAEMPIVSEKDGAAHPLAVSETFA